jgi:hypothetical protein
MYLSLQLHIYTRLGVMKMAKKKAKKKVAKKAAKKKKKK